ncbi:MAG: hypothetical protein VYE81_00510 [Planctomycetota bacterium]|nr:hypothetical protein [Planctomycetota bacterium]
MEEGDFETTEFKTTEFKTAELSSNTHTHTHHGTQTNGMILLRKVCRCGRRQPDVEIRSQLVPWLGQEEGAHAVLDEAGRPRLVLVRQGSGVLLSEAAQAVDLSMAGVAPAEELRNAVEAHARGETAALETGRLCARCLRVGLVPTYSPPRELALEPYVVFPRPR